MEEFDCVVEPVVVGVGEERLGVEGHVRGRDLVQHCTCFVYPLVLQVVVKLRE